MKPKALKQMLDNEENVIVLILEKVNSVVKARYMQMNLTQFLEQI